MHCMCPSAMSAGHHDFACLCEVTKPVAVVALQWPVNELDGGQQSTLVCNMVSNAIICSLYLHKIYDQRPMHCLWRDSMVSRVKEFGILEHCWMGDQMVILNNKVVDIITVT